MFLLQFVVLVRVTVVLIVVLLARLCLFVKLCIQWIGLDPAGMKGVVVISVLVRFVLTFGGLKAVWTGSLHPIVKLRLCRLRVGSLKTVLALQLTSMKPVT